MLAQITGHFAREATPSFFSQRLGTSITSSSWGGSEGGAFGWAAAGGAGGQATQEKALAEVPIETTTG